MIAKNLMSGAEYEVQLPDDITDTVLRADYWFEKNGHVYLLFKANEDPDKYHRYMYYEIGGQIYSSIVSNSYEELERMRPKQIQGRLF